MRWPPWLGVLERRWKKSPDEEVQPSKTVWDFLQLLIIPVILVAIALAFNASQASRERSREDRRIQEDRALAARRIQEDRALAQAEREDAVLDAYIAKMSGLILDRDLSRAKDGSAVRQVARTTTLTTLRRLDGRRKGEVVRFLYEARLLYQRRQHATGTWGPPLISLEGADLSGIDLTGAILGPAPESERIRLLLVGDLRNARFDKTELSLVHFGEVAITNLRGASFKDANIFGTSLASLDLRGVSFERTTFADVTFRFSDLRGTVFDDSSIDFGTNFDLTCLTNSSFVGAKFPDDDNTTFRGAIGQHVDFSDAVNLSAVRLSLGVSDVRFEGAKERPRRTARPSSPTDQQICNY